MRLFSVAILAMPGGRRLSIPAVHSELLVGESALGAGLDVAQCCRMQVPNAGGNPVFKAWQPGCKGGCSRT